MRKRVFGEFCTPPLEGRGRGDELLFVTLAVFPLSLLPPQWGEGSITFLLVQKSDAKRHAQEGDCDFPRLTNLKTCVCVLINFAYESVKYFDFLGSCTVGIFYSFVYDYFFDESVKHLGG